MCFKTVLPSLLRIATKIRGWKYNFKFWKSALSPKLGSKYALDSKLSGALQSYSIRGIIKIFSVLHMYMMYIVFQMECGLHCTATSSCSATSRSSYPEVSGMHVCIYKLNYKDPYLNCNLQWTKGWLPGQDSIFIIHYPSPWRWVLGMYLLLPGLRGKIISVGHVYWHDVSCWCTLVPRLCRYTTGTFHLDVCSHLCYVAFGVDCSYIVKHIGTATVSIWCLYTVY